MKQNVLLVALVAVVAALAVMVARQHSEIVELKQMAQAIPARPVAPTPPPAPAVAPEEPPAPAASAEPAPAPALEAGNTNNVGKNYMAVLASMMKNPGMKDMVRAQQKAMLARQYDSLLKYLSTRPPEQVETLKQLLEDRQMALVDSGLAMMGGSADERKKAMEDAKTIKADYDKKIADLLGPQDYEVFKQYEATQGERMQVQMFKDSLSSDVALNAQQENDLILAMAEETKNLPASSLLKKGEKADPSQMTEENINEAMKQLNLLQQRYADRAKAILTPAQLEQFTKWQEQWKTMSAAGLKMAATMFGNKGAAPSSSGANP
jgi:DNA replication protein DnaD